MSLDHRTKLDHLPPGRHAAGGGDGLALLVKADGRRTWIQRIKAGGRTQELGHGAWPAVGLREARRRATDVRELVDAGGDPLAARHAERRAQEDAEQAAERERQAQEAAEALVRSRSLRAGMEAYLEAHGPAWRSPKTERDIRTRLGLHAAELLDRPAADITLEDVRACLAKIWTAKPILAGKVRARLEDVLDFSIAAGWRPGPNPAVWRGGLKPLLAKVSAIHRTRHHPALPWQRVPAFVAALRQRQGDAAQCLMLCALTACRSGEARGATWDEFDFPNGNWTIPAVRSKTAQPHRIPLSAPAVALLRARLPGDGRKPQGLVFDNGKGGSWSDMALLAVVQRMHADAVEAGAGWVDEAGERITPHGFRTSFRSWCGDLGHPRELAELSLAHRIGSSVEQAYSRSDLLERRRELMNAWGAHCTDRARLKLVRA